MSVESESVIAYPEVFCGAIGRFATEVTDDSRVGTVAVLLAGGTSSEAVLAAAVALAAESRVRLSILVLPRQVPLGAHCGVGVGFTSPFAALLSAEALADAATSARRAASLVPAGIPADYVVVPGSPIRAMKELVERKAVAHLVVDRTLLVRRPRLRWASDRWARNGILLKIV